LMVRDSDPNFPTCDVASALGDVADDAAGEPHVVVRLDEHPHVARRPHLWRGAGGEGRRGAGGCLEAGGTSTPLLGGVERGSYRGASSEIFPARRYGD